MKKTYKENQQTISDWGNKTFGPSVGIANLSARANREMAELLSEATRFDPERGKVAEEIADVMVVLFRCADIVGVDALEEVDRKMEINRGRDWSKRRGH